MSQTVTLPDDLFSSLRFAADQRGISIQQVILEAVRGLESRSGISPPIAAGDELLLSATEALLDGTDPPIALNWDEIKQALMDTEPGYTTVEEAMQAVRGRPWSKDR